MEKGNNDKERLEPTKIEHLQSQKDHEKASLSHEELKDRLDTYSNISKSLEQSFKIEEIKKHYLNQIKKRENNRIKSDIYYAQGLNTGLPHKPHEKIKNDREIQDQKLRDDVAKQAKEEYRENSSLEKSFDEKEGNDSDLKKEFDKARDNLNTKPYHYKIKRDFDKVKDKTYPKIQQDFNKAKDKGMDIER